MRDNKNRMVGTLKIKLTILDGRVFLTATYTDEAGADLCGWPMQEVGNGGSLSLTPIYAFVGLDKPGVWSVRIGIDPDETGVGRDKGEGVEE